MKKVMKKSTAFFLVALTVMTVFMASGGKKVLAAPGNGHYSAFNYNGVKLKVKNQKLIVTGTFYKQGRANTWDYPIKWKNKKISLSKNVKYTFDDYGVIKKVSKNKFLSKYKKGSSVNLTIKSGKVVELNYSVTEAEL